LRLSRLDALATLTMPRGISIDEGRRFVEIKEGWLRTHLNAAPQAQAVQLGTILPVEGQDHIVAAKQSGAIHCEDGHLYVAGADERVPYKLLAYLKLRARDRLTIASDLYADQLGKTVQKITLRDTRSRWGSCSSHGALMYSWRLILAPPDVLDYVAAHEVAHLVEMNHSTRFWALVEQLYPGYAAPKQWLKVHGTELHRYRFGD
jgi:predicted metal-dependent hydrolase